MLFYIILLLVGRTLFEVLKNNAKATSPPKECKIIPINNDQQAKVG